MSACDKGGCEHLVALNIINGNFLAIQNENLDLKREILLLRSGKNPSTSDENYYQRWLEINKENQELTTKLSDSKRMVGELQPKLTQVLQSIQNIEKTLEWKNKKQGRSVLTALDARTSGATNVSSLEEEGNPVVKDKCTDDSISQKVYKEPDKTSLEDVPEDAENESSRTEEVADYNVDEATDTEDNPASTDLSVSTSYSGPNSLSTSQVSGANSEMMPFGMGHLFGLQNLPEEKPVFSECSICHETFPSYIRPEMKVFQGPPCCDKCKLPATATTSSSRGITFQYPKGSSGPRESSMSFDPRTNYPNDLATQYTTHVDDKPYQCQMCGKKFTRSHGLTKHIRIHTGEKPYVCKICGKSFAVSGRLALHIRIHTGEKPYECKFCGKRFNESSKLKIHYRKHTGEKPFTCEVCDKGFSQMSTLTAHCRRHLTETRNKCGKCGNGFRNPNALRGHRCLQICDSTLDVQNRTETILGDDR